MKINSLYSRIFGVVALLLSWSGAALAGDALAVDMFRHVVAQEKEGNVVFSPASAEAALLMLREGAAGQTRAELAALPYGKQGVQSSVQVETANALFAAEDLKLKPTGVKEIHRAPFERNRAQALRDVNTWCSRNTHGRISTLLQPQDIDANTRLIALNAVYLKGLWAEAFDKNATQKEPFIHPGGRTTMVQMMHKSAPFPLAEGKDWQAVALPYRATSGRGEPCYFIAILPSGDARAFAATLTPQKLESIRSSLRRAGKTKIALALPRFKTEMPAFSLSTPLRALGVSAAFSSAADFSGFTDEPLRLSDVRQKCFVQVDETGTEAAAVTAAIMMINALPRPEPPPHIIRFDKPFIWVIDDLSTDAPPYFMGLVETIDP